MTVYTAPMLNKEKLEYKANYCQILHTFLSLTAATFNSSMAPVKDLASRKAKFWLPTLKRIVESDFLIKVFNECGRTFVILSSKSIITKDRSLNLYN